MIPTPGMFSQVLPLHAKSAEVAELFDVLDQIETRLKAVQEAALGSTSGLGSTTEATCLTAVGVRTRQRLGDAMAIRVMERLAAGDLALPELLLHVKSGMMCFAAAHQRQLVDVAVVQLHPVVDEAESGEPEKLDLLLGLMERVSIA